MLQASCKIEFSKGSIFRFGAKFADRGVTVGVARLHRVMPTHRCRRIMMHHHVFDKVPEGDADGKKLIRAKWLNDDRGEKARERLVAMEISAFDGSATTITR